MASVIRIGTRDSRLAVWQASLVKQLLFQQGQEAILVPVKSEGDRDQRTPLYAMGVQGVFTRVLDAALLNDRIDVAVHSMKDVPVQLPEGITAGAILPRASYHDLLVFKDSVLPEHLERLKNGIPLPEATLTIATGSVRRKAQWLQRYPHHILEPLRGNVQTRLQKLRDNSWHGAIFAAAGLERIDSRPENAFTLDWMLPAPAQGAILIACREDDAPLRELCDKLNDPETELCVTEERDFLATLLGGCSTPISAHAYVQEGKLFFKGNICSPDGRDCLDVACESPLAAARFTGRKAGEQLLGQGGDHIVAKIKNAG
ncbi:hydroxymethylbilane synthase [Compostibacter hankyongensis]|uniref:Hydroxymethylbilane synthase n=1 Tax=Compostibacter hankyongensis TaxID=1007089 RepID=A0ABP8FYX3_9BACT